MHWNDSGPFAKSENYSRQAVPVGKETDQRWEQGEDPSMVDSDIFIYEKRTKLVIADASERKGFEAIG